MGVFMGNKKEDIKLLIKENPISFSAFVVGTSATAALFVDFTHTLLQDPESLKILPICMAGIGTTMLGSFGFGNLLLADQHDMCVKKVYRDSMENKNKKTKKVIKVKAIKRK